MKRVLIIVVCILCLCQVAQARDYIILHEKEMKHAEKYGATDQFFAEYSEKYDVKNNIVLKDPKLIKLSDYDEKVLATYNEKIKKDNVEYKKVRDYLRSSKVDDYNSQAYPEDFYKVYRVAERIIRANKLDYVNWRIVIDSKEKSFNASSSDLNCLTFNSGLIDTFKGNDDALALIVGHEIAHSMLGHAERISKIYLLLQDAERFGSPNLISYYRARLNVVAKNAEYAADVEGAKLVVKAMYDIDKAKEALSILNTMDYFIEKFSKHPSGEHRLENFEQNRHYFFVEEWAKQGKQNIIKSNVLNCEKSSNRNSIVILRGKVRDNSDYYRPEDSLDICKRIAYISYLDKDMKKAIKYFKKWSKMDKLNIIPYLYLSYIAEYHYNLTQKGKFIKIAKKQANIASTIDNENKYVKEQISELEKIQNNL